MCVNKPVYFGYMILNLSPLQVMFTLKLLDNQTGKCSLINTKFFGVVIVTIIIRGRTNDNVFLFVSLLTLSFRHKLIVPGHISLVRTPFLAVEAIAFAYFR